MLKVVLHHVVLGHGTGLPPQKKSLVGVAHPVVPTKR